MDFIDSLNAIVKAEIMVMALPFWSLFPIQVKNTVEVK